MIQSDDDTPLCIATTQQIAEELRRRTGISFYVIAIDGAESVSFECGYADPVMACAAMAQAVELIGERMSNDDAA